MLSRAEGLRWSGKSISNGRQRLASGRQFSSNAVQSPSHLTRRATSRQPPHASRLQQQFRSISLFGWGSSESKVDQASWSILPPPNDARAPAISQSSTGFEPNRTFKGSLSTSDTPDPSIFQHGPPGTHEPQILKSLEETITKPHPFSTTEAGAEPDILAIPERIGYLKDVCAIDFGYGTSSIFQFVLEHLHIYSGLSWGISIVTLTVIGRLLMFRSALRAQVVGNKMREIQPILNPLREQYKLAVASGDKITMQSTATQIRAVSRDSGVSMLPLFLPILLQIPFNFGGYRLGYHMSSLPVPALEHESFLWMSDLVLSDFYVMPALCAGMTFMTIRLTAAAVAAQQPGIMASLSKGMRYVLPPVSFLFIMWQPGINQIFFATQGAATYLQQVLFQSERGRKLVGLPAKVIQHSTAPAAIVGSDGAEQTQTIAGMNIAPRWSTSSSTTTTSSTYSKTPTGTRSSHSSRPNSITNYTPSPTPPTTTSSSPQNISIIDRAVNSAKKTTSSWRTGWQSAQKRVQGKTGDRIKEAENKKADSYEYRRRQDADVERRWRNERAGRGNR